MVDEEGGRGDEGGGIGMCVCVWTAERGVRIEFRK